MSLKYKKLLRICCDISLKSVKRSHSMWCNLVPLKPNTSHVLRAEYKASKSERKIDMVPGTFRNQNGKVHILGSVRKAEECIINKKKNKEYPGREGHGEFLKLVTDLAFDASMPRIQCGEFVTVQTLGLAGALRMLGDLFKRHAPVKLVFLPKPHRPIHVLMFKAAGIDVAYYNYMSYDPLGIRFECLMKEFCKIPDRSIVVLQASGNNPTGFDLKLKQWKEIADIVRYKRIFPVFDMSYMGLATGSIDDDASAVRLFCCKGIELALAQSFSANFGLYGERVGSLTMIMNGTEHVHAMTTELKDISKKLYYNPPLHGARIVREILCNNELKAQWLCEVRRMAEQIIWIRIKLRELLESMGYCRCWKHLTEQHGLYTALGLKESEVNKLRKSYSIYMRKDGACLAKINEKNIEYLAQAINCAIK